MREGQWTVLLVIHGAGNDPMNDDNVQVGLYMGADAMVKSGDGKVVTDYTFGIKPDAPDPSVVGQSVSVAFSLAVNAPGSGTPTCDAIM